MTEEQSDFKVEIVQVLAVEDHPGADRLDLLTIKGWQCVARKGEYSVGDKVIYIPIDSVLPEELEAKIFGADAKVKLSKSRVKTIKLRGAISQGMVIPMWYVEPDYKVGRDVTKELGITKYEPPPPKFQSVGGGSQPKKSYKHPNFDKYHKWPNIKNYPELFNPDDIVIVTEKIHGTNFKAGWLKWHGNKWWKKVLSWVGLAPEWQFVYGSHNVQISEKMLYDGFYDKNVYAETVVKYELKNRIPKGMLIFGEVYGAGIQKGYDYGLKDSRELVLFDAKVEDGGYLGYYEFKALAIRMLMPTAPELYIGQYAGFKLERHIAGPSTIDPKQKVREGCVIKTVDEQKCYAGSRKGTKCINPEYLLKNNTDFH